MESIATVNTNLPVKRGRKPKQNREKLDNTKIKTYHFNMLPATIDAVDYFATLHKYDDRKTFKEEWNKWIQQESIAEIIRIEMERLVENGYGGNVIQKIFHSARYYYRKKPIGSGDTGSEAGGGGEGEVKKRKKYEGIGKDVLEKMDAHILRLVKQNIVDVLRVGDKTVLYSDITPAHAFKLFLETEKVEEEMMAKYKKTYKNRFFLVR